MRKLLNTLAFILLCSQIDAQSQYRYEVEKVMNDIYLLKPSMNPYRWVTANIVVIVNEKDVTVVDSGLTPEAGAAALKEIMKITDKPITNLINTHWHGDHWQGNEAFAKAYPGINIIATTRGHIGIMRNGMLWMRQFYLKYHQMMLDNYNESIRSGTGEGGKKLSAEEIKTLKEGVAQVKLDLESIKNIKPTPPTMWFDEKLTIRSGSRIIECHYLGIGNTMGDAVVYLPAEKILIPGDLVVYPSPYESGAFSKDWLDTSKKLRQFPFTYLLPGHGPVLKDAVYLDYLNDLFTSVIVLMNNAFEEGHVTLAEAKKFVTHEKIVAELSKKPEYVDFVKQLDSGFITSALNTAYSGVKAGKTVD